MLYGSLVNCLLAGTHQPLYQFLYPEQTKQILQATVLLLSLTAYVKWWNAWYKIDWCSILKRTHSSLQPVWLSQTMHHWSPSSSGIICSRSRGRPPRTILHSECLTTLSLTVYIHTSNSVSDFLQVKCNLDGKRPFLGFEPHSVGLLATYDVHLRLIGKRVVDFLLVLTDPFSL